MTAITINVKGMDALREQLAETEVSPALQRAISEAVRQACGVMSGEIAKMAAASIASYHIAEMRQRYEDARPRRIVTEADLAAVGVKWLLPFIERAQAVALESLQDEQYDHTS